MFFVAVLFSFGIFFGCSDDDSKDPVIEPEETGPYSVKIADSNKNMPSGGTITFEFSDSPSGYDIGKIVDNNAFTKFTTSKNKFYILWQGSKAAAVNFYTLTSAADTPSKDPKSWSLFGSTDNSKWELLDKQTSQTFSKRQEKKEFSIDNETEYKYYKLEIESNNGGEGTQIAEWTIQVVEPIDTTLPYTVVVNDKNLNMPSAGTITSEFSDSPKESDISQIVDSYTGTKFVTYYDKFSIIWKGNESLAVDQYTLTSAGDTPEKDPKSWAFYASNDSIEWEKIDEQKDQSFAERKQTIVYKTENKLPYKYYRLSIESNNGGEGTQIAEWTMRGFPTDMTDLMAYAGGYSHSDQTPMGNHYANRHVTTEEDKVWLSTASNEPGLLGSADHLTQYKEFNVVLYPFGTPIPADVNQHGIGDCSALAVFASMAYVYPNFVKNLITDNGDKTYTVAMFDPQGKPISVTITSKFLADKDGNIGTMTGRNDQATWSTVLEKAIMKYNVIYKVNTDIGGIGSEHVAPLFTGNGDSFSFSPGRLSSQQLTRAVQMCLIQGKLVVGGFNKNQRIDGKYDTITGHAYTLIHSDDPAALFVMRNPWGFDSGRSNDGLLYIPNNVTIPPTIDLRIMDPGIAANTGSGTYEPYIPPVFKSGPTSMRVSPYILRQGL